MKTKTIILATIIFLILSFITPFLAISETGCVGGGPQGGCKIGRSPTQIVFPVYRTLSCKINSQPNCAVNTLLPGWNDRLTNVANLVILVFLSLVSYKLAKSRY